jgi:hypothetical protein
VKDDSNNSELRFLFWARKYLPHSRLLHLVREELQNSARNRYLEVLNSNLGKDFQLPVSILNDISPSALLSLLQILYSFEQPGPVRVVGAKEDDESTDGGAPTDAPPPPAKK